jgi:hypothetical protein
VIDLGWSRDQVLEITIPFLHALRREWKDYPPLRMMVAAALGHKPQRRSKDLNDLLAMFPGGKIV